jgi:hypothetical protein
MSRPRDPSVRWLRRALLRVVVRSRQHMKEFIEAFKGLRHAPWGLWMVIIAFSGDSMAY